MNININKINISAYNRVSEVAELLEEVKKDFPEESPSSFRFVVPSRDDKIWQPDKNIDRENLWTWDEIYKDVCSAGRTGRKRVLSPPDHLLILDSILKNVLASQECYDKAEKLPGLKRSGFLSIISRDIRELLNEDVKPDQLDFNPESDNASEFLLPKVYEEYLKYLNNYNLLDSAAVYTEALKEIQKNQTWGQDLILVFVGFLSFTHAQLALVYALGDRCKEVRILQPQTNLYNFHDVASQFGKQIFSFAQSTGTITNISVAEPGLEPEIIARELALSPEFYNNFDGVGIMIERGREAVFAEAFERYGIPYDFMSGVRINLTLPGKILSAIRHLNSRDFPAYETAMLLTQPCFAGNKFPVMKAYRAGCSGLDGWEEFLTSINNRDSEAENEIFSIALLAIKAIKIFRDIMNKGARPEKIMSAFHEFLTTEKLWLDRFISKNIAELPELDETIRTTASAIETIGSKVLALNELLPDLGAVQNDRLKAEEAYDFLERWCSNTDTRPPVQISNAVRIYTKTPPVLSSFNYWIMTGVTQKTWSNNINSSPLLGDKEREKLKALPKNSDKAVQREALFRRLIQVGELLTVISRPVLDEEGRPLSASPFYERFIYDMKGNWTVQEEKSYGIKSLLGSDDIIFNEIDPVGKIPRKTPVIFKKANAVGASDIQKLLSCPFLWWQEKGANLYPKDSDIVSQNEWGLMLHKFWERLWRRYGNNFKQNFYKLFLDEWKNLTENQDKDYKNFLRLVKDFRLKRKLEGIKFRADRLARIQNEILENFHEAGYTHERILLEEEAYLQSQKDGIKFLGQCDRIEFMRSPSGEKIAFIADYKEGVGERSEDSMTKIENYEWNFEKRKKFASGLQLSVYAALFEENYDTKLCGVYILGLEDGKISGSILNSEDFPEIWEIFSQYKSSKFKNSIGDRVDEGEYAMNCAAGVLKAGKFAPEYQSDSCKFCKIKSICRMGEFRGEILDNEE